MQNRTRPPAVLIMLLGLLFGSLATAAVAAPQPRGISPAMDVVQIPAHDRVVSEVPAPWTPQIKNGKVKDIAQTGDTIVVGGGFSEVTPSGGSPKMTRQNIFAFNATTGAINTGFAPSVSGEVLAVEPGPTATTVYIGGAFPGVNGVTGKVFLLNTTTGQIVTSFQAPGMNGAVMDLVKAGNRLYVGGYFTSVGNQPYRGLVTLNATTGARESFLNVALEGNHNWTGQQGQARGAVGAKAIAVDPAASTLAVVGNFKTAGGEPRDQMVLIDLTGATAQVRPDWNTRGFEPRCFDWAFDSYVRDVSFSPDGTYVAVAATGGPNPGTLCDTMTRWDINASGTDLQPTWIDDTGGDTLFTAAPSGPAVYTSGHERWHNNEGGRDRAAPGAVPRPGLAGVEAGTGLPLSWNPGRNPRGIGAEAATVTTAGLWVGSDTDYIGNFQYWRPRLAFFPLAGGKTVGPGATGELPSNVYLASTNGQAPPSGDVLFRVNAGGPAIPAADSGPDWAADTDSTSPWRNSGSNTAAYGPVPQVDPEVPSSTPSEIFDSERWDPGNRDDGSEMSWAIPVPAGEDLTVRLYFANRYSGTKTPGSRVFDVQLEGNTVLNDFDIVAQAGHDIGIVRQFDISSDGTVNIDLQHVTENPLINGIEITTDDGQAGPPQPGGLSRVFYEGGEVQHAVEPAPEGDIDWSAVRGAVVIDGELFYGLSNGTFYRRTFDGSSYGPEVLVDPYNDPEWSDVQTGSGQTYRGVRPSWYSQISGLQGMAYQDGRLYYSRSGSSQLYSRKFLPESGIMTEASSTVPGFAAPSLGGIFFDPAGDNLYFVNSATGDLSRVGWVDGAVQGAATIVSGPALDGMDWRGRALFLGPGPEPQVNHPPVARIGLPQCDGLTCDFNGSQSSDPDEGDSISSYTWDFGDDTPPMEGAQVSHEYTEADTYTVQLTVKDETGTSGSTTRDVEVTSAPPAAEAPSLVGKSASMSSSTSASLALPSGIQEGDLLVLFVTANDQDDPTGPTGVGAWDALKTVTSGPLAVRVYTRVATGAEAGQNVTLTTPRVLKTDLTALAYRGVSEGAIETLESATTRSTDTHATPTVTVDGTDRTVLSFWADRSSTTTGWTPPAQVTVLSTQVGSGGGRVSTLVGEANPGPGSYGGLVAKTNSASARGVTLTVVLAP